MKLGPWIRVLFEDYKFARRFALFWAIGVITYAVLKFFGMGAVSEHQATVIVAIIGILATVVAFYQWHRSNDE